MSTNSSVVSNNQPQEVDDELLPRLDVIHPPLDKVQ